MRLPDFLIAGAQKSGTGWLLQRLRQHPELFLPDHELHFFDKRFNYRKGHEWYASHFEAARPDQVPGEKTLNEELWDLLGREISAWGTWIGCLEEVAWREG